MQKHPSKSRKTSNSRDVGNSKDPSSNRNASFKQGTQARETTTSRAKRQQQQDPCGKASGRKWSQNVAVKGSQVAVVFARRGREVLQGSGNTDLANPAPPPHHWSYVAPSIPSPARLARYSYLYSNHSPLSLLSGQHGRMVEDRLKRLGLENEFRFSSSVLHIKKVVVFFSLTTTLAAQFVGIRGSQRIVRIVV